MKHPILIWIGLSLLITTPICSQIQIEGKIMDAETGQPVAFVNIGIKRLAAGTVSSETGYYKLTAKGAKPDDLIAISSIGYETIELSLAKLEKSPEVELIPQAYTIDDIELSAKKWKRKTITFGNTNRKRKHSVGFANSQLGTEIAALLPIEEETWIKSAHFVVNRGSRDSLLFRLNIFQYQNGQVGDNLVGENILIPAPSKEGLISIDLEKHNLVTDQPILLSLQWVKAYEETNELLITFNAQKAPAKDNLFLKPSSVSGFKMISETFPGAPKYEVCFYIEGQQVEK